MALLRSDIINRDLVENVLKQAEGTRRVTVNSISISNDVVSGGGGRASLLEERFAVKVTAKIKSAEKEYSWIAKVLRAEAGPSNYARFQGILETEINFYDRFVPSLQQIRCPLPRFYPLVWSDYSSLNREVLILEDMTDKNKHGLEAQPEEADGVKGLDLSHVVHAVEWLAQLHALSYVTINRHMRGVEGWLNDNRWIRKEDEDRKDRMDASEKQQTNGDASNGNIKVGGKDSDCNGSDKADSGVNAAGDPEESNRTRLTKMAVEAIKSEIDGGEKKLETLLQRQDWLDSLRKEMWANDDQGKSVQQHPDFKSVCHGEPWYGTVLFMHETPIIGGPRHVFEAVMGDLHACSYGRPGSDLAHFLVTSTTREFRKTYLDTVINAYVNQLDDVLESQGFPSNLYPCESVRRDYRRGLVLAITFTLFAMPRLTDTDDSDEVDAAGQVTLSGVARDRLVDGLKDLVDFKEQ